MMEVLSRLQNIFRDILDDEELVITENTGQNDIEDWDSIAQLNLVIAIEKEFNTKFKIDEIANIKSVKDMLKKINEKK